jgi:hypothetical protein
MIKKKILVTVLAVLFYFPLVGNTGTITLKTENMEEVINIHSFILNTKGEIFLFSSNLSKIFKFKPDGTFEKSFCSAGEGPGEISRVFSMYHNPVNDCLYLPDYFSMRKGKVTIYDSEGNFKGLLTPELSFTEMDRIWKIIFLKDGTYFIVTNERVDWKPVGKFFMTMDEIWVRYFSNEGKLQADIFKTQNIDELSQAVRYGGPQIIFKPDILVNKTPDEKYIAVAKTDETGISIFDKQGKKVKTIALEISREKLSDKEFGEKKKELLDRYKGETDGRMYYLTKNMIKLKYKPVYYSQFLTHGYIILEKIDSTDEDGYVKTSKLIFFDWNGKKKAEKTVAGYVMNIMDGKGLIISYDEEANEHFRIELLVPDIDKESKKNE